MYEELIERARACPIDWTHDLYPTDDAGLHEKTLMRMPLKGSAVPGGRVCIRRGPPLKRGACVYRLGSLVEDSYLVDPASSHMLVSKIKPCMSKCKYLYTVKLRMAH